MESWHSLYFDAWEDLRFDRAYGSMGGQTPISYMAMSQFARDHGLVQSDFRLLRVFVQAIDAEWLAFVDEKAKANS